MRCAHARFSRATSATCDHAPAGGARSIGSGTTTREGDPLVSRRAHCAALPLRLRALLFGVQADSRSSQVSRVGAGGCTRTLPMRKAIPRTAKIHQRVTHPS